MVVAVSTVLHHNLASWAQLSGAVALLAGHWVVSFRSTRSEDPVEISRGSYNGFRGHGVAEARMVEIFFELKLLLL